MKRNPALVEWTRRDACIACFSAAGAAALAACTPQDHPPVGTGGLDGTNGNGPDAPGHEPIDADTGSGSGSGSAHPTPDAATHSPDAATHSPDAVVPPPDAPSGATCTTSATDVGAVSTYSLNTPVYNSTARVFVVKDGGGFYAVSGLCTHEGAVCRIQSGYIYCPRHGAEFTYDGAIVSGPVSRALAHYSMCTLSNGHLGVTSATTSSSTRYNP